MLVWDKIAKGNAIASHQFGGQLRRSLEGCRARVAPVFAHLDADRTLISPSFVVGVLALFVGWQRLVNAVIVNGEAPGEIAQRVVA